MAGCGNLSFDVNAFNAKYGGVTICKYAEKHVLYAQGNAAKALYFIQKGKCQLTVVSERGKERVVGVLEAGEFCGEGCLSKRLLHVSSAVTMTECTVARLEKSVVVRVLHEDVSFSELFVSYLLSRNVRLTDDLIDHLFNSSERRLARTLLLLANFAESDRQDIPPVKVNQQTLAKIVGTTRSRINFFMNKFRRLGYIDYKNQVTIHPSLLNVVLHDQWEADGRSEISDQAGVPMHW